MSSSVKNEHDHEGYRTARQWAKSGCLPKEGATGQELWANRNCQNKFVYYSPGKVESATAEQLNAFFRKERDRNNIKQRMRREKARERLELERKEKEQKREQKLIAPYLAEISKLRKIVNELIESKRPCMGNGAELIIDVETTGLDPGTDEILQLSIIDRAGNVLFDSYFKPYTEHWDEAQNVNGISLETVRYAPRIWEKVVEINSILSQADNVIGYNHEHFDLIFMAENGIYIPKETKTIDIMPIFAEIYGEWNDYFGQFQWQKLTTAADYYNYDWSECPDGAHNSLADCYAALFVYEQIMKDEKCHGDTV